MNVRMLFIGVLLLSLTTATFGQRSKLAPGDAAPAIDVAEWVKGDPVTLESGNVYVVEFWATWCGPCRKAMPHLTELQERYEQDGLIIIGISYEEADVVKRFVSSQDEMMGYRVAVDKSSRTKRAYMDAAGIDGIPASFVIDRRGQVQFVGNPHDEEFEHVLEAVMEGRYDAKLFEQAKPVFNQIESTRKMRNWRLTFSHIDQLLELDSHVFAPLTLTKFEIMLVDMDDRQAAYEYARELLSTYADDPTLLMNLARKIAVDPKIDKEDRDFDVALAATEAAMRSARPNNPKTLSMQALVYFNAGKVDDAISTQRRAWMIADPKYKAGYERVLRSYQDARGGSARSNRSF